MALIKFKNKPNTDTPINDDNLNHNFNELDERSNYSTEEQVVGTWIDGKPIYKKVYSINVSGTSYNRDISSLNIDNLIKINGISQGNPRTMNYYSSSTDNLRVFITGDNKLYISSGETYPTKPFTTIVILEYTKTTD